MISVNSEFLLICRVLGIQGTGRGGRLVDTSELLDQMQEDPEFLTEIRALREHLWRTYNRVQAQALISLLLNGARYLSDLVGGDLPVLAPREIVYASTDWLSLTIAMPFSSASRCSDASDRNSAANASNSQPRLPRRSRGFLMACLPERLLRQTSTSPRRTWQPVSG